MFMLRQYPAWEPFRKSALRLARNIVLSTLGAALLVAVKDLTPDLEQAETTDTAPVTASIAPEPIGVRTIRGAIRAGKGFSESLALAGLNPAIIPHVVQGLSPKLDFQRLKTGDRFTAVVDHGGDLVSLTYEKSVREALVLRSGPDGWRTELAPLPVETRVEEVRGTIRSSLFESMSAAGETDALTLDFVELFAWDIDFSNELQPGDTFRVVVEKIYRDGRFLEYGRLLAAEYRDQGETHRAYWYPWPDARGDYYTPEGNSVRASFLRSPISYTRISSGFSLARRHPILNKVRPHLGVDYAAPAGTPVWAPADGVVAAAGFDKGAGNHLVLRHPGSYESHFLHLSRFAKGLRVGDRVSQREVIGYVGSTGLSTGPHLDYRVRRAGRWVNPLQEKFPRAERLPAAAGASFAAHRSWLDGEEYTPLGSGTKAVAAR